MSDVNYDSLLKQYKESVDQRVEAIRREESLATQDHSMVAMEHWDTAGLQVQDAEAIAKKARVSIKTACAGRIMASNGRA